MKYLYVNGCSMSDGSCLIPYSDERIKRLGLKHTEWDIGFDERWSKLLSDKFGLEEINEARHGGSNDRIVRMTIEWCNNNQDKINDTLFVIGWTNYDRFEFWDNYLDRYVQVSNGEPTHNDRDDKRLRKVVEEHWKERHNIIQTKNKCVRNIILFQSFFKSNNLPFLFCDTLGSLLSMIRESEYTDLIDKNSWWNYSKEIDSFAKLAADMKSYGIDYDSGEGHPGIEAHAKFANKLYETLDV